MARDVGTRSFRRDLDDHERRLGQLEIEFEEGGGGEGGGGSPLTLTDGATTLAGVKKITVQNGLSLLDPDEEEKSVHLSTVPILEVRDEAEAVVSEVAILIFDGAFAVEGEEGELGDKIARITAGGGGGGGGDPATLDTFFVNGEYGEGAGFLVAPEETGTIGELEFDQPADHTILIQGVLSCGTDKEIELAGSMQLSLVDEEGNNVYSILQVRGVVTPEKVNEIRFAAIIPAGGWGDPVDEEDGDVIHRRLFLTFVNGDPERNFIVYNDMSVLEPGKGSAHSSFGLAIDLDAAAGSGGGASLLVAGGGEEIPDVSRIDLGEGLTLIDNENGQVEIRPWKSIGALGTAIIQDRQVKEEEAANGMLAGSFFKLTNQDQIEFEAHVGVMQLSEEEQEVAVQIVVHDFNDPEVKYVIGQKVLKLQPSEEVNVDVYGYLEAAVPNLIEPGEGEVAEPFVSVRIVPGADFDIQAFGNGEGRAGYLAIKQL